MLKNNTLLEKIVIWIVIIIVAYGAGWSVYYFGSRYYYYLKFSSFNQALEDYFKNDTYGGATPQATYEMFISALKRGDTEEASKYFNWEYQEKEKARFDEMKEKGELDEYVNDFPDWSVMELDESFSSDDFKRYLYPEYREKEKIIDINGQKITLPAGEYLVTLDFYLNELAEIWKIDSL